MPVKKKPTSKKVLKKNEKAKVIKKKHPVYIARLILGVPIV